MKNCLFLLPVLALSACAQYSNQAPEPPPPVAQVGLAPNSTRPVPPADNQRLYGNDNATLVAPESAQKVLDQFRAAYGSPSAPRIVVYVNRELISPAGMKLTGHTEKYENSESKGQNARSTEKTSGTNTYSLKEGAAPTLADRQTVREVERLFGRAFRNAGARLADQATAAALIPDEPGHRLTGDQAGKDRQALAQVADVAVEVLISSRNLTMTEVSGDKTYSVPDIQVTAIRLKDSAIIGQASASDVLGRDRNAGRIVQQFDMRDITEATALALMEDMLTGTK